MPKTDNPISNPPAIQHEQIDTSKRKLSTAALAGPVVLSTFASRRVLASTGDGLAYKCTVSGQVSGNHSHAPGDTNCNTLGLSPGCWKNNCCMSVVGTESTTGGTPASEACYGSNGISTVSCDTVKTNTSSKPFPTSGTQYWNGSKWKNSASSYVYKVVITAASGGTTTTTYTAEKSDCTNYGWPSNYGGIPIDAGTTKFKDVFGVEDPCGGGHLLWEILLTGSEFTNLGLTDLSGYHMLARSAVADLLTALTYYDPTSPTSFPLTPDQVVALYKVGTHQMSAEAAASYFTGVNSTQFATWLAGIDIASYLGSFWTEGEVNGCPHST